MYVIVPEAKTLEYKQKLNNIEEFKKLEKELTIRALLTSTYVLTAEDQTNQEKRLLTSYFNIERRIKESKLFGVTIKKKAYDSVGPETNIILTQDHESYSGDFNQFTDFVQTTLNRINEQLMPWYGSKQEAIVESNEINYMVDQYVALTKKEYKLKTSVASLYDVIKQIDPNIDAHLNQIEKEHYHFD